MYQEQERVTLKRRNWANFAMSGRIAQVLPGMLYVVEVRVSNRPIRYLAEATELRREA